ncbi:thioredoxin-dependent thiol peroxidase [Lentibacillus amyloliquefaciens]|uniref:thioredoxin-dependent peroxiredoxin n=1 Tax=Lentibacillus amyloliquefaciens TaxID=1472767 RepID=A0A0U4F5T4_9BACI|nr:thioredoxin-dependent thiol peroxidase [Lentibacillus amyloliquefaciens]ALX48950.1 peroxiredoxin [Lentibacillus amyloliquefaciens]
MRAEVGKQAPEFTLNNQDGEQISLSDYKGQNIVLYFYPKDMTPGCTNEACDFRDNKEKFSDLNAVIIGVSPDPVESHQKFIDKHDLPFMLLADVDHQAAEDYGVWNDGIERSTFIIDKEGNLQKEFRKVKVDGHVEEALGYLREAS